jgi:hypothetical protein
MKKLIFGLIATVMFGFVSSANPINENKTKNAKTFKELTKVTAPVRCDGNWASTKRCDGIWGSTRIYALNQGFSADQSSCIAMAAYIACMGVDAIEVKSQVGSLC